MTLNINGKIIPLKIGLKGSILLNQEPNLNVETNPDFVLYCALIANDPSITVDDLRDIPAGHRIELAREILTWPRPTTEKVKELYSWAVGEIGISPADAWAMTEEEIDLAYEGYAHRQELTANLMLLVLKKAKHNAWDNIELVEDKGYRVGTDKERLEVFANLGICQEELI